MEKQLWSWHQGKRMRETGFLRMGLRLVGEGKLFKKSILYSSDKVELLQQVQNYECSHPGVHRGLLSGPTKMSKSRCPNPLYRMV